MNFTAKAHFLEIVGYACAESKDLAMFGFFQDGILFCSLLAGLCCLCHILFGRTWPCKNSRLLVSIVFTGLCHVIFCAYAMDASKTSLNIQIPRGGDPICLDISFPAILANTIVLTILAIYIIRRNIRPSIRARLVQTVILFFVSLGLGQNIVEELGDDKIYKGPQEKFLSIGREPDTKTDLFWSVCQKSVDGELVSLIFEYALIYFPVLVAVVVGWYRSSVHTNVSSIMCLRIVQQDCSRENGQPCFCSKLNSALVAILIYSFLLLIIIRPALIVYGHMTSGLFRDIFPGLTNTVLYCFLCGEYFLCNWKVSKMDNKATEVQTMTDDKFQIKGNEIV